MRKLNIRGYEPPCTLWMRVELEDAVMAARKDPVVNSETTVSIERQSSAQSSKLDGGNVVVENPYDVSWGE